MITTSLSRGIVTSMFLRLCSRAPRTMMASRGKCSTRVPGSRQSRRQSGTIVSSRPNTNKGASVATVILALGDAALRRLCESELAEGWALCGGDCAAAGGDDLESRVRGDVLLVDGSPLGRDAARAGAVPYANRMVGLAVEAPGVPSLALPLGPWRLIDAVERLCGTQPAQRAGLTLEASRRVARANGREVALSRSEYQLLAALLSHRGARCRRRRRRRRCGGRGSGRARRGAAGARAQPAVEAGADRAGERGAVVAGPGLRASGVKHTGIGHRA